MGGFGNYEGYNVIRHGATVGGILDDTPAFIETWKMACDDNVGISKIIVPQPGSYLLSRAVIFNGSCCPYCIIVERTMKGDMEDIL